MFDGSHEPANLYTKPESRQLQGVVAILIVNTSSVQMFIISIVVIAVNKVGRGRERYY